MDGTLNMSFKPLIIKPGIPHLWEHTAVLDYP
jgi:hypothetical protein